MFQVFILCVIFAFFFCSSLAEWAIQPWPNQFSMIQYQYWTLSDGNLAIQNSSVYYNYDRFSYRCDNVFVKGSLPSSVPKNVTSIWINNTLSIMTYPYNDDTSSGYGNN